MAAATVASSQANQAGIKRVRSAILTAPANNDTWDSGLLGIENCQVSARGAVAATDAIGYTISGGVVTFLVTGVARDLDVRVVGT